MARGTTQTLQIVDEFVITPDDAADISADAGNPDGYEVVGLNVETAGDLKVTYVKGSTITRHFASGYHPIAVTRVWATGQTAAGDITAIITE